jgi:hypothetical protein
MKGKALLSTLPMLAGLALLAPAAPARAAERPTVNRRTGLFEIPASDLRKAAERGDRAELSRAAERLGPARLGKALADPDRRLVLAALEGIPLLASGILLLDQVVPLLGSTDAAIRERAVRTTAALLATSDPELLAEWEVPAETMAASCRGMAALAANEGATVTARLAALQGLADAGPLCAGSFEPARLLGSAPAEIRRAAVLALPATSGTNEMLIRAARDPDGRVAAAAGARLCQRRAKRPAAERPLRELATAEGAAPEDVVDMVPCLAASTEVADQKTLLDLREHGPSAVRDAVKSDAEQRSRP